MQGRKENAGRTITDTTRSIALEVRTTRSIALEVVKVTGRSQRSFGLFLVLGSEKMNHQETLRRPQKELIPLIDTGPGRYIE
jgi:hypothetical protein